MLSGLTRPVGLFTYSFIHVVVRTMYHSVDQNISSAINVCKFEFKISFAPEKFAFLKY